METWKQIPELEGYYEASDQGRIRRSKSGKGTRIGRINTLQENPNGYLQVATSINGKENRHWVHRLIASTFLGDVESKEVHHQDDNPRNNRIDNLRIVTTRQHRQIGVKNRTDVLRERVLLWRERESKGAR